MLLWFILYRVSDASQLQGQECIDAVVSALATGYRFIDTAQVKPS
jgi:diketogulonate reductase-like aldo/keto reductase